MIPPGADAGEFVLRLLTTGGWALVLYLLKEAWGEMREFKREFGDMRLNHGERLTAVETALGMAPRRRLSDQGDDNG